MARPQRSATSGAVRTGYFPETRQDRYSLLFALPLLVLYEALAAALSVDGQGVRNGADVILKRLFMSVLGARGGVVLGVLLVVGMLALVIRDRRRAGRPIRGGYFPVMLVESALLAIVFGIVVGLVTQQIVSPMSRPGLALNQLDALGGATGLMVSLGAGLYEELLFRVLLVSALLFLSSKVMGWGPITSGLVATVLGALVFSAFHYVGAYGDRMELDSFVFRTVAGLAFSGLYVLRGFGITAWTHALYDVFLLLR